MWQNNTKSPNAPMFRTIACPPDRPASIHNTSIASNKGLNTSQGTQQMGKMLRKSFIIANQGKIYQKCGKITPNRLTHPCFVPSHTLQTEQQEFTILLLLQI